MYGYTNASRPIPARETAPQLFPRVVAAIDFSPASLAATRWAIAHVASQSDAAVAHVMPSPHSADDDERLDADELRSRLAERPALRGGLGGFAATLDVASVRTIVRLGRASQWLSIIAAESKASLLILGRRVDSNRRGIGEPNVLERSARRTSASVLVVPEGTTEPPRHIVAAIDRSAVSERVLAHAHALARLHACPMTVVHVVSPTTESYDRVLRSSRSRSETPSTDVSTALVSTEPAPASAQWIARALVRLGLHDQARVHVVTGDAAREIVRHAGQCDSPLIIAGKHGDDSAPVGSTGSVARELIMRAPFPVLAIGEDTRQV